MKYKHLPQYLAPSTLSKISSLMITHLPEDQKENKDVHSSAEVQNTLPDCQGMRQRQSNLQAPLFESWP